MIIRTNYLGPTNTRGGRIKASNICGKSVTIPWNHELGIDANHRAAASACLDAHGDADLIDRTQYCCFWDEGGGAVFVSMAGRDLFQI